MDGDNEHLPRVPLWRWILRLLALIFQLAPVLRYADSIRYGLLSRKAGKEEIKFKNDHIARYFIFLTNSFIKHYFYDRIWKPIFLYKSKLISCL